jgi:hypothetical protein
MSQDEKKWTSSLRTVILAFAFVEAVGIALAVWRSLAKG